MESVLHVNYQLSLETGLFYNSKPSAALKQNSIKSLNYCTKLLEINLYTLMK